MDLPQRDRINSDEVAHLLIETNIEKDLEKINKKLTSLSCLYAIKYLGQNIKEKKWEENDLPEEVQKIRLPLNNLLEEISRKINFSFCNNNFRI